MTGDPTVTESKPARAAARWRVSGLGGALVLGGIGLPALFGGPVGAATTTSLAPFLLKSHEEPGFTVSGHPTTIATPSGLIASGSLTKSESKSFVDTLQKAGFVKAVEENTKGSGSNEGLSLVIQFSNPAVLKRARRCSCRWPSRVRAGRSCSAWPVSRERKVSP